MWECKHPLPLWNDAGLLPKRQLLHQLQRNCAILGWFQHRYKIHISNPRPPHSHAIHSPPLLPPKQNAHQQQLPTDNAVPDVPVHHQQLHQQVRRGRLRHHRLRLRSAIQRPLIQDRMHRHVRREGRRGERHVHGVRVLRDLYPQERQQGRCLSQERPQLQWCLEFQ